MSLSKEKKGIIPLFIKADLVPDDIDIVEMCEACEKVSGVGSIDGATIVNRLWRVLPFNEVARSTLLFSGIKIKGKKLDFEGRNPFLHPSGKGEAQTTRLFIEGLPWSYSQAAVARNLEIAGFKLRSGMKWMKGRKKSTRRMTDFRDGRRSVYIDIPDTKIFKLKMGDFLSTLKYPDMEVTCFRCLQEGHTSKNCPNEEVCHNCKKSGHRRDQCPEGKKKRDRDMDSDNEVDNDRVDPVDALCIKATLVAEENVLAQTMIAVEEQLMSEIWCEVIHHTVDGAAEQAEGMDDAADADAVKDAVVDMAATDADAETGIVSEVESGAIVDAGADADADADAALVTEAVAQVGTAVVSEADVETTIASEAESGAIVDAGADADAALVIDTVDQVEDVVDAAAEVETEFAIVVGADDEAQVATPRVEDDVQLEVVDEADGSVDVAVVAEAEVAAEAVAKTGSDVAAEAVVEAGADVASEAVAAAEADVVSEAIVVAESDATADAVVVSAADVSADAEAVAEAAAILEADDAADADVALKGASVDAAKPCIEVTAGAMADTVEATEAVATEDMQSEFPSSADSPLSAFIKNVQFADLPSTSRNLTKASGSSGLSGRGSSGERFKRAFWTLLSPPKDNVSESSEGPRAKKNN